jgi:hypothetical protein
MWDIFDVNETPAPPYPKPGSFEKRSHTTPTKNQHRGKRRNTNPDDAFIKCPVFELGTFPSAKKEEDPITIVPAKESSDPILNRILSHLEQQSDSLEKPSFSIDQQSKSLEHLAIRVDAIEERRSQRSSRSHSRPEARGENKQKKDVPAQALESLLNSREQRERKVGFQSVFNDDPAYVPSRTAPQTSDKRTALGANKATPILRPTHIMPSILGC